MGTSEPKVNGWIVDGIRHQRSFQISSIPVIIGASLSVGIPNNTKTMTCSATTDGLGGTLFGRLLEGTRMGDFPPVAYLYIIEMSMNLWKILKT
uniref:Uncharacterized protein n=1 Tax=Lactuca sativa TaxID=4236 RepID=A0A9R1V3H1_LACSA|nr:hypothetical protein LSAT_V11C700374040 [Lactuca sativa]